MGSDQFLVTPHFRTESLSDSLRFSSEDIPYLSIETPKASGVAQEVRDEWHSLRARYPFKYLSWAQMVKPMAHISHWKYGHQIGGVRMIFEEGTRLIQHEVNLDSSVPAQINIDLDKGHKHEGNRLRVFGQILSVKADSQGHVFSVTGNDFFNPDRPKGITSDIDILGSENGNDTLVVDTNYPLSLTYSGRYFNGRDSGTSNDRLILKGAGWMVSEIPSYEDSSMRDPAKKHFRAVRSEEGEIIQTVTAINIDRYEIQQ